MLHIVSHIAKIENTNNALKGTIRAIRTRVDPNDKREKGTKVGNGWSKQTEKKKA